MSKQNKRMLKVKHFIKNTPSKLYDIHQQTRQNLRWGFLQK